MPGERRDVERQQVSRGEREREDESRQVEKVRPAVRGEKSVERARAGERRGERRHIEKVRADERAERILLLVVVKVTVDVRERETRGEIADGRGETSRERNGGESIRGRIVEGARVDERGMKSSGVNESRTE